LGGNSNGNPAPVKRPGTVSFVRPPGDDTPKPGTPPPTSSPAIDNEKVKEQEKSIEQLKTALVRLQQQTKGAMEDMVQKIEAQSKERLKLEYVMRDMKYTLKEEKEARQRLEQQNRALYNEIQVLKQRDASDDQDDEFSGMSAGELRNQVRYVTSHLAQETRSRQDLVSLVQRLQGDLESVQRQLRRDNSSVNGGHVYGK
jgi:chromosome segregation ATPase